MNPSNTTTNGQGTYPLALTTLVRGLLDQHLGPRPLGTPSLGPIVVLSALGREAPPLWNVSTIKAPCVGAGSHTAFGPPRPMLRCGGQPGRCGIFGALAALRRGPPPLFGTTKAPATLGPATLSPQLGRAHLALWNHLGSRRFWAAVSAAFGRAGPPLHSLETHFKVNTFNIWPTVNPFNKSCPFFAGEKSGGVAW